MQSALSSSICAGTAVSLHRKGVQHRSSSSNCTASTTLRPFQSSLFPGTPMITRPCLGCVWQEHGNSMVARRPSALRVEAGRRDYNGSGYRQSQQGRNGSDGDGWQSGRDRPGRRFPPDEKTLGKLVVPGIAAVAVALVAGPIIGAVLLASGAVALAMMATGTALFTVMGLFLPVMLGAGFFMTLGGTIGLIAAVGSLVVPAAFIMLGVGAAGLLSSSAAKQFSFTSPAGTRAGPANAVWEIEVEDGPPGGRKPESEAERREREMADDEQRIKKELAEFDDWLRTAEEQRRGRERRSGL